MKVVSAYSSKAQDMVCTIWLLDYKYFVHFSVWTKCQSDGVENCAQVWRISRVDTNMTQQNSISQLIIQLVTRYSNSLVRTTKHAMERTNRSKLSFHYTA